MDSDFIILLFTAASLGFFHTALGPDHYIPFVALSKSENWTKLKTFRLTLYCGIGHLLSSIIIGVVGYFVGISIFSLEKIDSFRGDIASWLLIIFGLLYTVWGIMLYFKRKSHSHFHTHLNGISHSHKHNHNSEHIHYHNSETKISPWFIFIIFVFGPCEPLIPLLIYPAASLNIAAVIGVMVIFSFCTLVTMQIMVFLVLYGFNLFPAKSIQNLSHTIAGVSVLFCGLTIKLWGL